MHRMGRRALGLLAVVLASCGASERAPNDVRVALYRVELANGFDDADARSPAIAEAIEKSGADVVCIQRAWLGQKSKLIERLRAKYPYAIVLPTNADTQPTDARDQNGNVPPRPTAPPCADPKSKAALDPAIKCLADNCARTPGDINSPVKDEKCPVSFCTAELLQLSNSARTCFGCGRIGLEERSIEGARKWCTTEVNAGFAHAGEHGGALISRLPFVDSELHVLPSTWNKSVVLRGSLRLSNGATVDAYCAQLDDAREGGLTDPYAGAYGKGQTDVDGWRNEQMLQAERTVAFVASKNRPAIVVGDFGTSPALPPLSANRAPATYGYLAAQWTQTDSAPSCTWCNDHGGWWTDTEPQTRTLWIFARGADIKSGGVAFTERTFTMKGVPVTPTWQYGVASTISVR